MVWEVTPHTQSTPRPTSGKPPTLERFEGLLLVTPACTREMFTLKEPRGPEILWFLVLPRPPGAAAPAAGRAERRPRAPQCPGGGGGGCVLPGLRAGASEGLRLSSAEPAWRTRSSPMPGAGPRTTAMPLWPEPCRLRGAATW